MYIGEKDFFKRDNKFENFLNDLENNKFDVFLWGAGQGADWVIRLLRSYHIEPIGIIDKDATKHGKSKMSVKIVSLEYVLDYRKERNIKVLIAAPKYEREIYHYITNFFDEKEIASFECELYCHFVRDIASYRAYLEKNQQQLLQLSNMFEDGLSKKTFDNVIMGRLTGDLSYFKEVCVDNQYFPCDIIQLSESESILDIGASIGDTLKDIVKTTNGKFNKIWCFEPEIKSVECLKKYINELGFSNIQVIQKGAWDKNITLCFQADYEHGASRIIEDINSDKTYIDVVRMDDLIKENITYIKMDIEGAELNAIKGAERIIKENKPTLAICVYHKNEDLLNITSSIKALVPEYKLYLRHHNVSGTETVLYAKL